MLGPNLRSVVRRLPLTAALCAWICLFAARPAHAQDTIGAPIEVGDEPDNTPKKAAAPAKDAAKAKDKAKDRARAPKPAGSPDAPDTKGATPAAPHESVPAAAAATPPPTGGEAPASPTEPTPSAPGPQTVQLPTDSEASIIKSWQTRVERLAAGDSKRVANEESNIRTAKENLGLENLFGPAMALIREADDLVQKGRGADALARCNEAAVLAPSFSLAYDCIARATLAKDQTAIGTSISAVNRAISVALDDVRSRRILITDVSLTLLFALVLACVVFVLLLIVRHAMLTLHDFHHLFPAIVPRWQTTVVAVVLVLLPILLGFGVLGSVALVAVGIGVTANRIEAILLAVVFVFLAAAQYGTAATMRAGAFGRVAQDVYLLERGDAPAAAALRLESRSDKGLGEYSTAFALGHYYKRLGRFTDAKAAYAAALKLNPTPELMNNIGNVQFLEGDTDGATQNYNNANHKATQLAAPLWNLAKIYFKETKMELGGQAVKEARELDPAHAAKMAGQDDMRANEYLVDIPLSDDAIAALADREGEQEMAAGGATWSLLTGRLSETSVELLAFLAALAIGLAHALQRPLKASSRCEKCGRAVCCRCDPELGQTVGMCGQCISVFVRRTGVDGPDRVRKEIEVKEFRRRQRLIMRVTGAVVGGGGQILSGRVLIGGFFLALFSLFFSEVIFWNGVLRTPYAVTVSSSALHVGAYALVFLGLYALSLLHLVRTEETD